MMIEVGIFLTEMIKYIIFLKYYLGEQIKRWWVALIILVLYMTMVNQVALLSVFTVVCSTIALFIMTEKIYGKMIIVVVLLNSIAEVLVHYEEKNFAQYEIMVSKEINYLVVNVVIIAMLLFGKMVLQKKRKQKINVSSNVIHIVLGIVAELLSLTVSLLMFVTQYVQNNGVIILLEVFSVIGLGGIFLLLLLVLRIDKLNQNLERAYATEHSLKEAQEVYYQTLLEREEETRRYRHDISGHIVCLKQMSEQGELQEVAAYIESMQHQLNSIKSTIYDTKNHVFNIMLNYYIGMFTKQVNVKVTGTFQRNLDVSNYDLCTIYSNVLKNAVEEINRNEEENPMLKINIDEGVSYTKIEICNTSSKKEINEGKIKTTKSDTKNHGIGMQNVYQTIEKCQGKYEISYNNGIFRTQIFLPIVIQSEK